MSVFSTPSQLDEMRQMLVNYSRLPFSQDSIPGALMESALARVHGGEVLNTYDFVDVISDDRHHGWQVKSTKETTTVTWKRAKIPNAVALIEASKQSDAGLQILGDAIIEFCNEHVRASVERYNLDKIGYARLIVHRNRQATYFERLLYSKEYPHIFNPKDFTWQWSTPKKTADKDKEQLPALHGSNVKTGRKWWAWHGRGENQLHFSGETVWWPTAGTPHTFSFHLPQPENKLSYDQFAALLQGLDA